MISAVTSRLERLSAVQEVLLLWGLSFTAIVLAFIATGGPTSTAKVVATVSFLYLPLVVMRRRNEDYPDYGITFRAWRTDLKLFALLFGIVGPLYVLVFWVYATAFPHLPEAIAKVVAPYPSLPPFAFRLPTEFPERVIDNLLVVALPEEFFYRGYLQARLRDAFPGGRVIFGGRLGKAFWITAILFAVGHLAIFEVYRLSVLFPALLFGWMRERTGTVMGAALFHACANVLQAVLEASFFGMHQR